MLGKEVGDIVDDEVDGDFDNVFGVDIHADASNYNLALDVEAVIKNDFAVAVGFGEDKKADVGAGVVAKIIE